MKGDMLMETKASRDLSRLPTIRVEGQLLPGFPIKSWSDFAIYVKELLKNPAYKIMGQLPDPPNVLMDIKKPEQVDSVLAAGGEINICGVYRPLVG